MSWLNKLTGEKKTELTEQEKISNDFEAVPEGITQEGINEPEIQEKEIPDGPGPEIQELQTAIELTEEEKAVAEVKGVRIGIDETLQVADALFGNKSNVYDKIFIGKAWLGKLLAELNNKNPYTTEKPVANASEIPPTADVANNMSSVIRYMRLKNQIEQIVSLREALDKDISGIESLRTDLEFIKDKRLAAIAKTQSYVNICEAKFELGNQLALIRDKNK